MNYTYPTSDMQRVPGYRNTEPAMQSMFEARHVNKQRQDEFNNELQIDRNKDGYLELISEELKYRSQAWKHQIFEMGKLLYEAKKRLEHGEFKPWVEANFELGYRTAHNCMRVYHACLSHPEVVQYFSPSCIYIVCKPSFPEDLRQALFEGVNGPVDVTKKEIVQVAMKYKKGEISIEDDEVQDLLTKERNSTIWERIRIELEALDSLFENRLNRISALVNTQGCNPAIKEDEYNFDFEEETGEFIERLRGVEAQIITMIEEVKQKNETVS